MRRIKTIIIITMAIVMMAGCSSKKAYDSEDTSDSVQVYNKNETDKILEIDEKSAQQLVSERLDTTKYSVEKEDEITIDDADYYVFRILQEGEPLSMGVAVNKISGELFAYKEDKTIAPYSEFTLYDENEDATINWEGTYNSDNATLELMPADSNSFEFILTSKESNVTISGVAQASGTEAVYEEESGYKITFINENDSISVSVSGTSTQDVSFQGNYSK